MKVYKLLSCKKCLGDGVINKKYYCNGNIIVDDIKECRKCSATGVEAIESKTKLVRLKNGRSRYSYRAKKF